MFKIRTSVPVLSEISYRLAHFRNSSIDLFSIVLATLHTRHVVSVAGTAKGEGRVENDEICALTNILHKNGNGSQAIVNSTEAGTLIMEWGQTRKY